MYRHMTWEECETRYPRLVKAMQWAACLSRCEAACAIRDYRDGLEAACGRNPFGDERFTGPEIEIWGHEMLVYGGGEAVSHFGGPLRAITRAIKSRHRTQWFYGRTQNNGD